MYVIYKHGLSEITEEIFCSVVHMKTNNMTCAATNSVPLSASAIYVDTSAVNGSIPASSYIPFCNPNGRDVLYYELCSSVCLLSLSSDGAYRWAIHTLFILRVGPLLL